MAKKKQQSGFSLKDHLFNRERVRYLADLLHAADKSIDPSKFTNQCVKPFPKLELKQRIVQIAETLEKFLSVKYGDACKTIVDALPPPLDPTKTDDDFGDFIIAPLGEFIVRNGLGKQDVRRSLRTLREITKRFSMEDAIRSFIDEHEAITLAELSKWTKDKNYHVRRLVSEGTRPLLPWSGRLSIDLLVPLPFLDELHTDPTRYVTRSVANHLNDIAKSHPKVVLDRLKQWKKAGQQEEKELDWMCRHSLRTLVKQGDKASLRFLGFRANPKVRVEQLEISTPKVKRGELLEFSFAIEAERNESLMVDYVIDFVKSDGSRSPKVFKLKQLELAKGERVELSKRHRLKADATTFTLYPGTHCLSLQVNGTKLSAEEFNVV